jgi:cyanate lyase
VILHTQIDTSTQIVNGPAMKLLIEEEFGDGIMGEVTST